MCPQRQWLSWPEDTDEICAILGIETPTKEQRAKIDIVLENVAEMSAERAIENHRPLGCI